MLVGLQYIFIFFAYNIYSGILTYISIVKIIYMSCVFSACEAVCEKAMVCVRVSGFVFESACQKVCVCAR